MTGEDRHMERLSHIRTSNDKNKRTTTKKNANNSQMGKKKYNKETDKKLQRNEIIQSKGARSVSFFTFYAD